MRTTALLAVTTLVAFGLPLESRAEIYKWIDAEGRVHYSERKEGTSKPQMVELKDATRASTNSPNTGSSEYWQEQERRFRQRQIEKSAGGAAEKAAGATTTTASTHARNRSPTAARMAPTPRAAISRGTFSTARWFTVTASRWTSTTPRPPNATSRRFATNRSVSSQRTDHADRDLSRG